MGLESYLGSVSFAVILAICSVEDLRQRRIPDPTLGVGFIVAFLLSPSVRESLTAGGIGFSFFLTVRFLSRGRLGFGDVKLSGYLATFLGTRVWWAAVSIASSSALVVLVARACSPRANLDASLPFAPFLAVAALAALLLERVAPSLFVVLST